MKINKIELILVIIFFSLILFLFSNIFFIGASWDEWWEHVLGSKRLKYITSLGEYDNYEFAFAAKYYPGFFATLTVFVLNFFNENFFQKYIFELRHIIYFIFSCLSLLGFYKFLKLFFNRILALIACVLTVLNPFFFTHMIMNPKDILIFFSIIWFILYFYKYINENQSLNNLLLFSFFVGFGTGIRLTFVSLTLPIFLVGFLYLIKKDCFNSLSKIFYKIIHFLIFLIILFAIPISTWPNVIEGNFLLLYETIIKSLNWEGVPAFSLINGSLYETSNTPRSYFFYFLIYRMPIFLTLLFLLSFLLIKFDFKFFKNFFGNDFVIKFFYLSLFFFYPIILSLLFKVKIYDNIRLFLFLVPFFSIFCSFSLIYLLSTFKTSLKSKVSIFIIFIFFIFFLQRFISLNPYQYSYVNFSHIKLDSANGNFENDYWGISFKELIIVIKKSFRKDEIDNMKISVCGGSKHILGYYLYRDLGIKKIYNIEDSTHLIMTNRASFNKNDKTSCFNKYSGKDILKVSRNDLTMSVLRKLN